MAFWALATGSTLRASGSRFGWVLMLAGLIYGGYFFLVVAGALQFADLVEFTGLFVLPLWMLLTGVEFLREGARGGLAASGDTSAG